MKFYYYLSIVMPLLILGNFSLATDKPKFDLLSYLEGDWKCRTINVKGHDINEPRMIKYVRSKSDDSLYGDVGRTSIIYKRDFRSGLILRVELTFSGRRPTTSVLVGKYDSENHRMIWRDGDKDGIIQMVWKLDGTRRIIPELDPDWVKMKEKEMEKSKIPQDPPSHPTSSFVWEKMNNSTKAPRKPFGMGSGREKKHPDNVR